MAPDQATSIEDAPPSTGHSSTGKSTEGAPPSTGHSSTGNSSTGKSSTKNSLGPDDAARHSEQPSTAAAQNALFQSGGRSVQPHAVSQLSALEGKHGLHIYKTWYFWAGCTIIWVDLGILPVVYFYAFKYGTSLNMQDIFAIITGLFGLFAFLHYAFRSLRLLIIQKYAKKYRPLGWTKMGILEFFHINVAITVILVEIELIVGTIPSNPIVRLCAMVPATMVFWYGFVFLYSAIMTALKKRLPFNMSSTPKGALWKPALYAIIEDFGAIEGSGETIYREQLLLRYNESWRFRRLLNVLTWLWGVGLICDGIVATVLIFELPEDVGFGVGWALPIAWCVAMGLITYVYVKRALKKEAESWHKMRCTTLPTGAEEGGLVTMP